MRSGPWQRDRDENGNIVYGNKPEVFQGTVIVSIGRSLPSQGRYVVLSPERWTEFKEAVGYIFPAEHCVFEGDGTGFYEGSLEDSATFVYANTTYGQGQKQALAFLARQFAQDSVAVTLGQTQFVEGK